MVSSVMIIYDRYIVGVTVEPTEHDSILVIHPNAVVTGPSPFQRLEPVSDGEAKVPQLVGDVQKVQFPPDNRPDGQWYTPGCPGGDAMEWILWCPITEI